MTERQWLALDVIAAAGGLLIAVFNIHPPQAGLTQAPRGLLAMMLVVAGTLPVAVRRIWPLPVLVVVAAAISALISAGRSPYALDALAGMATYTVAIRLDRRWSVPALAGTELALGVALAVAEIRAVAGNDGLHSLIVVGAAWFIGDSVRTRREYLAGLIEQAEVRRRLEVERQGQAVQAERMRIARELHDVVAHSLAVMTVQAGVGERVMTQRPAETRRALQAITTTGRMAQDELRLVLSLLREDEPEAAELAPAPGLGDLAELVETVRAAGTPVEVRISGTSAGLSPAIELSIFRIIQEALTNVVKHAGGSHTTVELAVTGQEIRIEVADDGEATGSARPAAGSRHGILGMRERAAAFGGSLSAGRRPGVGYLVVARIPVQAVP